MSLFDFVTVMISMILALSLGQLLTGVTFLIKTGRDIRWHPPHVLWLVILGLCHINHWWSLWDFRAVEWTYLSFMYVLIAPIMVAFSVGLLIPDSSDSASNDQSAQFARVRRPFAAVTFCYALAMWFDGPLIVGQDPLGAIGLLHVPMVAATAVTFATPGRLANIVAPSVLLAALCGVIVIRILG